MALFGFGKKKEEKKSASCCCSGEGCASSRCDAKEASVLILGSGCKSCQTLEATPGLLWPRWGIPSRWWAM